MVIAAARKRGVARFLHCSTESILFRSTSSEGDVADDALLPADDAPGPYTRSKLLAERLAMQAAASGFPVIIGCPTMPIGPHDRNLTPPTAMLRHFLGGRHSNSRRLCRESRRCARCRRRADPCDGARTDRTPLRSRWRKHAAEDEFSNSWRRSAVAAARCIPVPGRIAEMVTAMLEFIADHVTHRPPSGTAEGVRIALRARALSIEKAQRELGYAPRPVEPVAARNHCASAWRRPDNQTEWDSTPDRHARPFHVESPVRRLIESRNTDRDMLNDPRQWFAFALSGWTTTWPTQLLAIIWICWVISWVVASFWSGQTQKHVVTSDCSTYRLPILAGAILFMPLDGKVLGEKPLWQFGDRRHLRAGVPCRLRVSRSPGGREFISGVSGRTRSRTRRAIGSSTPAPTGWCATRSIRG